MEKVTVAIKKALLNMFYMAVIVAIAALATWFFGGGFDNWMDGPKFY